MITSPSQQVLLCRNDLSSLINRLDPDPQVRGKQFEPVAKWFFENSEAISIQKDALILLLRPTVVVNFSKVVFAPSNR